LVENLVALELLKSRLNRGLDPHLYFFRDHHGREVDLIFQSGRELVPIEIKAATRFSTDFLKNIRFFQELVGERAPKSYLIYAGDEEQMVGSVELLRYTGVARIVS
jgi:uncharacterized protein